MLRTCSRSVYHTLTYTRRVSRSRAIIVAILLAFVGAACTTAADPVDDFGPEDLVKVLEAEGAAVSVARWPYPPTLDGVTGDVQLLCIDGREAQLAVYTTTEDRIADADDEPPEPQASIDLYWGAIGWWARGRVLVSLAHIPDREDETVHALTHVLGPMLGTTGFVFTSEDPPEEIPSSVYCS